MAARNLTKNQLQRRTLMLDRLMTGKIESASELRSYLARYHAIHVTVDTIQRDLNAMLRARSVRRVRHPSAGHYMGNGSWVADRGWEAVLKHGEAECCGGSCDFGSDKDPCHGTAYVADEDMEGNWIHECEKHRGRASG